MGSGGFGGEAFFDTHLMQHPGNTPILPCPTPNYTHSYGPDYSMSLDSYSIGPDAGKEPLQAVPCTPALRVQQRLWTSRTPQTEDLRLNFTCEDNAVITGIIMLVLLCTWFIYEQMKILQQWVGGAVLGFALWLKYVSFMSLSIYSVCIINTMWLLLLLTGVTTLSGHL